MENIVIDKKMVPPGYVMCFNSDCPRHGECLRWIVGQQASDNLRVATTVLPSVLKLSRCTYYRKAETLRMAWGFSKLFEDVKRKDAKPLRDAMVEYLGGNGTYSRYRLGRRMLSPQQQDYILDLFRRRGYTEGLEFDNYVTTYDLDH